MDGPEGHGGAPLLHAAYKNFAGICEILLDSGASPHVAFTRSGHIQLESPAITPQHEDHWHQVLCEPSQGGCSLLQLRTEGVTALHLAAWHGSVRICWALIQASARPDARDRLHRSALMLSAERGHLEVVRLLLEQRAHLHASLQGHTAASLAARANQIATIQLLLEGKADVDYVAWFGAPTMLHIAAYWRYQGLASALLLQKANTEAALTPGGVRPLMVAAERGSVEVCQLLLGFRAEVGAVDDVGESAWQKVRTTFGGDSLLRCPSSLNPALIITDALGIISGSVNLKEFSDYRLNFEGVKRILEGLRKAKGGGHVELPASWLDVLMYGVNESYDTAHTSATSQDRRCGKGSRAACRAGIKIRSDKPDEVNALSPSILREKILDVLLDVGDVELECRRALDVDWMHVQEKGTIFHRIARSVMNFGKGLINSIRSAFGYFLAKMQKKNEECVQKQQKAESKAAADLPNASMIRSEAEVIRGLRSSEAVLDGFDKKGKKSEAELDKEVRLLKETATEMEVAAATGKGATKKLEKLEKQSEGLEEKTCEAKAGREAKGFRQIIDEVARGKVPQLGIRGIGGWASILAGGLEEVIDFRTREIGLFATGGAVAGTSMAGVTVGGYVGVGWKGARALNQSLGDYGPGPSLFAAVGASIPLPIPIASFGMGITYEIDGDEHLGGPPYKPLARDPGTYIYAGWSFSLGLYTGPVGIDIGSSMAKAPIHVDCFNDTSGLRWAIPKVTCKDCQSVPMKAAVTALRTVQHLATFPIITDLFFIFLAYLNDRPAIRGDFEGACSTEPHSIFVYAAEILQEAFEAIEGLEEHLKKLEHAMDVSRRKEIPFSAEFKKLYRELENLKVVNAKYAPLDDFSLSPRGAANITAGAESAGWLRFEDFDIWWRLRWRSAQALCTRLQLPRDKCNAHDVYDKLKMNQRWRNPFGFCNVFDRQSCELPNATCKVLPWGRSKNGRATKFAYGKLSTLGQCLCMDGYRYKYDHGRGHHCAEVPPKGAERVRQLLDDARRWVEVRKLELGGYVRDLLIAASS
ncbi:ANK3 [Symbiodinium natans]|uniref:ANK3 protein n=1 Tax=Symbiodinium natans TaxID=878477 RepID=A0A812U4J3_9DINO|nr:ANK3 [Symbiodinium natans]